MLIGLVEPTGTWQIRPNRKGGLMVSSSAPLPAFLLMWIDDDDDGDEEFVDEEEEIALIAEASSAF
jgi:hypothetical protein